MMSVRTLVLGFVSSLCVVMGVDRYGRGMSRCVLMWACCVGILGCAQGVFVGSAVAWNLPEGRAYEMVSPPYKADYPVWYDGLGGGTAAAPDGESFVFSSIGAYAGTKNFYLAANYVARRTPDGWVTSSTSPPPMGAYGVSSEPIYSSDLCGINQFSYPGGDQSLSNRVLMTVDLCAPGISQELSFVQQPSIALNPAGCAVHHPRTVECATYYASDDLSHMIAEARQSGLYMLSGLGGPEPREEVFAIAGEPDGPGGSILPNCVSAPEIGLHPISRDASVVFFHYCGVPYVRVNNSVTFASPGVFLSASADGSKAFFDKGGELWMALIDREPGHEALSETVAVAPGVQASEVVTSDDGSHVYFTSTSVLAGVNAERRSPQAGASNLYVYDSVARQTTFIAVTGIVREGQGDYEAQTTPDGHFLVFATDSRLTPDDTDTAADVYRYDTQTGTLERVSVGENGHDNNGNNDAFGASIAPLKAASQDPQAITDWRLATRAISDDGSTIVFSTAEPLSVRAVNGNTNVYVWHEGRVGMISTGHSQTSDEHPVVSQSGRDIFFFTTQGILPQDTDGLLDIYDARIGGGFPEPSVPAGGCSGDTCQGPPSVPSLLGAPASATFHGLGNPVAPVSKAVVKPKVKPKPKCRRGYARDKKGRCVRVKRRAHKAAATAARGRGHKSSGGGRS